MLTTHEKNAKTKLTATVVAVFVVAGVILILDHVKANDKAVATTATQSTASTSQPATNTATVAPTGSASAAGSTTSTNTSDGTYTAASDYYVPHGEENIEVSLTVKSGVITDASIQNSENDRDSAVYQENFASAYKTYVIGKSINGLKLSVISGASDTTQGFNDALSQIQTKVQA